MIARVLVQCPDTLRDNGTSLSHIPPFHPPFVPQLESVVRCVLDLLDRGSEERILVFSTWHDVLTLLEHAFLANGVPYARPAGGRKLGQVLSAFQGAGGPSAKAGAPAPRVLLLAIKQGGNGLNLTAAQHVILVEPLLSSGLEAQAAGRVDRVGQTRETHVHRWVKGGPDVSKGRAWLGHRVCNLPCSRKRAHQQ